jgi:hypothetical protein
MTQTAYGQSSSSPMVGPDLTVLSPDQIKVFNDAREAKALVDWVHKEYERAKSARQKIERQWALNMAMYTGKQNMSYFPARNGAPGNGLLSNPPTTPYVSRRVFNRIRPIVRTEYARITSNKPNASVIPSSSEDADLFAAQAAEQVWQSYYSTKKLGAIFGQSAFWLTICGVSFTKVWWDAEGYDCLTEQVGSIESGCVTPYHLFVPDLYAVDIEDQPFVINVYTKTQQWVKDTFGLEVSASVATAKSPFESAMIVLGKNEAVPDSVLLYEAWLKPGAHKLFPEGGMLTLVDTHIVQISDTPPYNHKQYPFIKWEHIPTGLFYTESVVTDLIDCQREYNRTRNQLIEAKNRMAKPQLVAPKGSIDASKITTQPGQVIFYKPGMNPPQPLPLQPIPGYVLQELDRTIVDMEDISSQHQVSRGESPPGVTAATAINFMQERDDSLLTSTFQSVEVGWEKWAKQVISHAVQYWDVPRTVSVTGVDGSFDAVALKGTELAAGKDIRMEAGSALPVSKSAKQAFLMDCMRMGFIDPEKGLSLMDMGGMDQLYDELQIDERQAQRENLRMARLDIEQIMQHEQQAQMQNEFAAMQEQQMMDQQQQQQMQMGAPPVQNGGPMGSNPMPGGAPPPMPPPGPGVGGGQDPNSIPPSDPNASVDPNTGQPLPQDPNQQVVTGGPPGPSGSDPTSGAPLTIPMNLVPVNTWDNHQLHIDVHNRYRKSQAFELLAPQIKQQFEYHVQTHAMTLNQAASAAAALPPPPSDLGEAGGAHNGSGTPVGAKPPTNANQFGPPGTDNGAPPPDPSMMGMQNG